jgi:uncharacterized protein YndB with AHSA1/START domain
MVDPMEPTYRVQLKIRKFAPEVFDAIVNLEKLNGYFVQTSSGPMTEGATVKWRFAEVPGEHDVQVRRVVKDQRIKFEWHAASGDYMISVDMTFEPLDAETTMVQISETGWRGTPEDAKSSHGNAGGWMHMMCCLKAYLEYGKNCGRVERVSSDRTINSANLPVAGGGNGSDSGHMYQCARYTNIIAEVYKCPTEATRTGFVAMSMSAKSLCAQRRRADLRSVLPETILPVAAN